MYDTRNVLFKDIYQSQSEISGINITVAYNIENYKTLRQILYMFLLIYPSLKFLND